MYNKLFAKIVRSSIWLSPDPQRIAWITFLALMDQDGFADIASVANLAHIARIPIEDAQAAVTAFESPDPHGPEQEHDGRRIERVPGGWIVLNAEKYRNLATREIQRESTRKRVQAYRDRKRGNGGVTLASRTVTQSDSYSDHTQKQRKPRAPAAPFDPASVEGLNPEAWADWIAYRSQGKHKLQPSSIPAAAKALAAFGDKQAAVVANSIANGYRGLFEPPAPRANGYDPLAKLTWRPTE